MKCEHNRLKSQCKECKGWFPDKEINIDHIKPAGSLNCAEDLAEFVKRLFCEIDNLQCLCKTCHDKKTLAERKIKTKKI